MKQDYKANYEQGRRMEREVGVSPQIAYSNSKQYF